MATSLVHFMTSLGPSFCIAMGSILQNAWVSLINNAAVTGALSGNGRMFVIPTS